MANLMGIRGRGAAIVWLVFGCAGVSRAAQPRIEFEIYTEPGLNAAATSQKWVKLLTDLGVSGAEFRGKQSGDRIAMEGRGTGATAAIHITAQLDGRGALVTPGGAFSLSDSAKFKKWLGDLQSGGTENLGQPRTIFGLTAKQFEDVRRTLATPVAATTKGVAATKAVEDIAATLKLPLSIEPAAQKALSADDPVRDELEGVAGGTALAAIARPAGAVLAPRITERGIELALVEAKEKSDAWPIGWAPLEKDEGKTIPALFQFINVEIDENTPCSEALAAIQKRLKVAFLMDHNNMARQRTDLEKKVKLAATKTFYRRILDQVLFQVRMKFEVRADDGGRPFLWMTTLVQDEERKQ